MGWFATGKEFSTALCHVIVSNGLVRLYMAYSDGGIYNWRHYLLKRSPRLVMVLSFKLALVTQSGEYIQLGIYELNLIIKYAERLITDVRWQMSNKRTPAAPPSLQ